MSSVARPQIVAPVQVTAQQAQASAKSCLDVTVALLISFPLTPVYALIRGAVLAQLWAWFIAGRFDLPVMPLALAVGISLVVSALALQSSGATDEPILGYTVKALTVFIGFTLRMAAILLTGHFIWYHQIGFTS